MKNVFLYLWQLPQNLVGLFLKLFYKKDEHPCRTAPDIDITVSKKFRGGISLGKYIFLSTRINWSSKVEHEYGHCLQSQMLGPLYLFVVGLPSLLHKWLYKGDNYYDFYTEKWADKLVSKYYEKR